ncbi:hypothetical protein WT58_26045 [Burkholderia territorii]|nr:hypothetical protein WT58_26045 [Burkholderia territorii]
MTLRPGGACRGPLSTKRIARIVLARTPCAYRIECLRCVASYVDASFAAGVLAEFLLLRDPRDFAR